LSTLEQIPRYNLGVICILLLATGLRLWGLTERGIYDYDEAWYLLEAKTLYYTGDYLLSAVGLSDVDTSQGLKAYVKQRGTVPMTSVKPGHTILTFLGMVVLGTYDYAGLGVSALSGILTVLLVFLIGKELGGTRLGIAAALILAVSPLHIHYSRSMYSQSNAVLFATLGAYLWVRHQNRNTASLWLFGAGAAIGYAFTCHFNIAWVTVGFISLELLMGCIRKVEIRQRLLSVGMFASGMAAPAALFELAGQLTKKIGLFPQDYPTYLGQFLHRQGLGEKLVVSARQVPFWTERLMATEGILVTLLVVAGTLFLLINLRHARLREVALLGLPAMALLPPSLLAIDGLYYILRNYAIALPALALLAGVGYLSVEKHFANRWSFARPLLATVCVAILITTAMGRSWSIRQLKSSYRDAASQLVAQLEKQGGRLATRPLSAWPIWYFYLSNEFDRAPANIQKQIRFYPKQNQEGDYELVDIKSYYRAVLQKSHSAISPT
jgi:4-amino-4-deoxy-L-arabinose transferase-like glycosyltransferase